MPWITGLTILITLVPAVLFLFIAGIEVWKVPGFLFIYLFPYFAVAASAWVSRNEARATWVLLLVACGVTGLGLCCVLNLVNPLMSFMMPLLQFLLWLFGGLMAGRRREALC